ncbi:MAG: hypothetical protein L0154_02930, partial [Chloroflexi bacterium]|nr:hypothetical protein [Chloroflexota bacterium]
MKLRSLPIFVLTCAVLLTTNTALYGMEHKQQGESYAQTGDDIPYLMAFATDPAPHFIIERADGTDSRIFAADVMAADTNMVAGPGWSPSGQWFAWTANALYKETNTGDRPYVVSVDGQTRPTALDNMNRVSMAWSPTEDILLVAGLLNPPEIALNPETHIFETTNDAETLTMRIGLLDPATDTFLQVQDMPAPFDRRDLLYVRYRAAWTYDSRHGLALANVYDEDTASEIIRFYRIGLDGDVGVADYDPATFVSGIDGLVISPYGEVAALLPPAKLQIINAVGDVNNITIPSTQRIINAQWSANGEQLLVQTELPPREGNNTLADHGLWVWSRSSNAITELFKGDTSERSSPLAAVTPNPDFSGVFFIWLNNGRDTARYASMDGAKIFDFAEVPSVVRAVWNATGQVAFGLEDGSYVVYDISGDVPVKRGTFAWSVEIDPVLSPNGLTVGYVYNEVYLIEVASGETRILPPDSRRYFASSRGEMSWYATLQWSFLFEDALVAGGGAPYYTGVVNTDGSVRRPLG